MRSRIVYTTAFAFMIVPGCGPREGCHAAAPQHGDAPATQPATQPATRSEDKVAALLMTAQHGMAGEQVGALDALAGYPEQGHMLCPILRTLLDSPVADVDRAAARALWAMGEEASPQWVDAAQSRDGYTRRLGLAALADERLPLPPLVVPEFIRIPIASLQNASPLVRQPAAQTLCRFWPATAPQLIGAMKAGDTVVRDVLFEEMTKTNALTMKGVDEKLQLDMGRELSPKLLHLYRHGDQIERHRAFCALTLFPAASLGAESIPFLKQASLDSSRTVRREAFLLLKNITPEQFGPGRVQYLIKMAGDSDADISKQAAEVLATVKDPVPELMDGLHSNDMEVRLGCMKAVAQRGDSAKDPKVIAAFAAATMNLSDPIRQAAIEWARTLKDAAADQMTRDLAKQLKDNARFDEFYGRKLFTAIELLGHYGKLPDISLPILEAALDDPNVRLAAIVALRSFGADAKSAIPQLVKIQQNDARMAPAVAETLLTCGAEGRKAAAGYYVPHLRTPAGVEDLIQTLTVLEQIGPDAAAAEPILREMLSSNNNDVRVGVARALGAIGPLSRPAMPALTRMVDNRQSEVRHAAVEALIHIAPDGKGLGPAMMAAIYNRDRFLATRLAGAVRQSGDIAALMRRAGDLADNDPDAAVRGAARDVMQVLSSGAVPARSTAPAQR